MTTGLLMFVHMHDAEHHEHHDHNKCQICQHFLLSPKKAVIEPETTIKNIELFSHNVHYYTQDKLPTKKLQSIYPRAPPVI